MAYACLMVPAQKWFPNRIGFASGVIIAGFGIGGFVMSPIETKFTNPRNLKTDDDDYFDDSELLDRIPYLFLILGAGCGVVQLLGSFFIAGPASLESQEESEHKKTIVKTESEVRLTICQTCMSPMVQIMFITMFLNGVWLQVMSGLFKAYGEKFIKDDLFLAVTDSMGAVSNTISRVIWGYVVDKLAYQKSMLILCTIGSFFIWTLPLIRLWAEKYVFLLWIFIMFSCLGGTYALIPYCLHRCYGSYNFGVAYGVVQGALLNGEEVLTNLEKRFFHVPFQYEQNSFHYK
uniref:Oxalate:formate antiporter n=1 Tax=Acrobeloides nanus TaxID=290746 RepID=A0A914E5U9_9BILA